MSSSYIGIENELITYVGGKPRDFDSETFDRLKSKFKKHYPISDTSIRTDKGLGFYIDGNEIEILTPPVRINQGFATRLTDLLMLGREAIVDASVPGQVHTGYSMHWNVTNPGNLDGGFFFRRVAVPFYLFGLTPLSIGANIRGKDNARFELLGDSITNENQINSLALILGAYQQAAVNGNSPVFKIAATNRNFFEGISDGRYAKINITGPNEETTSTVQAQQYLESFYEWLSPVIKKVGTPAEISKLEDFISGRAQLEQDKFDYYAFVRDSGLKREGLYYPNTEKVDEKTFTTLVSKTEKDRALPLEGRLLGQLITSKGDNIREMDWGQICFTDQPPIEGISHIYKYCATLNRGLHLPAKNPTIGTLPAQRDPKNFNEIEFSFDKRNLLTDKIPSSVAHYLSLELKQKGKKAMLSRLCTIGGSFGVSFLLGVALGGILENRTIREKANEILQYKIPQTSTNQPITNVSTNQLPTQVEEKKNG